MEEKNNVIYNVMKILVIASLFVALVSFLFDFVYIKESYAVYDGYGKYLNEAHVNGIWTVIYDNILIINGKKFDSGIVLMKIVFSIEIATVFAYMFSKEINDEKKKNIFEIILLLMSFTVCLIVFIISVAIKGDLERKLISTYKNYYDNYNVSVKTLTYIPLIIDFLIVGAYFILKFAKKKEKDSNFVQEINKYFDLKVGGLLNEEEYKLFKSELMKKLLSSKKPNDTVKFISEMKILLDNKAITESEFNKIKSFAL